MYQRSSSEHRLLSASVNSLLSCRSFIESMWKVEMTDAVIIRFLSLCDVNIHPCVWQKLPSFLNRSHSKCVTTNLLKVQIVDARIYARARKHAQSCVTHIYAHTHTYVWTYTCLVHAFSCSLIRTLFMTFPLEGCFSRSQTSLPSTTFKVTM